MIHNLLVGYDGSAASDAAFDLGLDLARRYDADLHVLAVARPPEFGEDVETEAVIEQTQRHFDQVLKPLQTRAEGMRAHFQVVVGHPAEQLVLYAERHHIDHIVVGHRGHSRFDRWLMGSVTKRVVSYAPCAVTVVRPRA
jgi:nucleotide-binding universal stress UspA family protein